MSQSDNPESVLTANPVAEGAPSAVAANPTTRWLALALAVVVFAADQASKLWIVNGVMADGERVIPLTSFFNIVMAWNRGVSFGMFSGILTPWTLLGFSVLFAGGLGLWLWRTPVLTLRLGLALMIGGALGNAIDRVRWGAVADFLDVYAFGWHFWAFNVADAAISTGAALLILDSLFRRQS